MAGSGAAGRGRPAAGGPAASTTGSPAGSTGPRRGHEHQPTPEGDPGQRACPLSAPKPFDQRAEKAQEEEEPAAGKEDHRLQQVLVAAVEALDPCGGAEVWQLSARAGPPPSRERAGSPPRMVARLSNRQTEKVATL